MVSVVHYGFFLSEDNGRTFRQVSTGLHAGNVSEHILHVLKNNPDACAQSYENGYTAHDTRANMVWRWAPEA